MVDSVMGFDFPSGNTSTQHADQVIDSSPCQPRSFPELPEFASSLPLMYNFLWHSHLNTESELEKL